MSDDVITSTVRSRTIGIPGRSLNSARSNHWIIDSSGGTPEAVTTVESFLAGISACGATLVDSLGREAGIALDSVAVDIEGARPVADPTVFGRITMRFELTGVDQEQAERLIESYKNR